MTFRLRTHMAASCDAMNDIGTTRLKELALKASVDVRTVMKLLRGERVVGMARDRAVAVLRKAGIELPKPRPVEVRS